VNDGELASVDPALIAVKGHILAFAQVLLPQHAVLLRRVNAQRGASDQADLAELPGNHCRVRGAPAGRGQHAVGCSQAFDIFRRDILPDEDHLPPLATTFDGPLRAEYDFARGNAEAGRDGRRKQDCLSPGGNAQPLDLVERQAIKPPQRLGRRDPLFPNHVDSDLQGGPRRAFGIARLENLETAVLDRELEILHVVELVLESRVKSCSSSRAPSRRT